MEPRRRRCEHGLRVSLNYGSKGCDIGHRGRCGVNPLRIWMVIIAPKIPVLAPKVMMPSTMPPIGIATGVVIIVIRPTGRLGLSAQGAQDQEQAKHQDNGRPSFEVHSLTLQNIFANSGFTS